MEDQAAYNTLTPKTPDIGMRFHKTMDPQKTVYTVQLVTGQNPAYPSAKEDRAVFLIAFGRGVAAIGGLDAVAIPLEIFYEYFTPAAND